MKSAYPWFLAFVLSATLTSRTALAQCGFQSDYGVYTDVTADGTNVYTSVQLDGTTNMAQNCFLPPGVVHTATTYNLTNGIGGWGGQASGCPDCYLVSTNDQSIPEDSECFLGGDCFFDWSGEVWCSLAERYVFTSGGPQITILLITSPSQNQNFTLADSNYTQTVPIAYAVSGGTGGQTQWSVSLTYETTGGFPRTPDTVTSGFSTTGSNSYTTQYTSVGGQLTANATQGSQSPSVTSYISGVQIPTSTMVSQLIAIYGSSQPTPHLMTGIASVESSIQQFTSSSLYGQTLFWPYASISDGGSHVGLMQMPTSMDYAFNWQDNASNAVALFNSKESIANTVAANEISSDTGLPALTGVQLENMALLLYGPYAGGTNPALQYYVPSCVGGTISGSNCVGGSWQWVVNTAGNANGVAYANSCRSQMQ